MKEIDSNPFNLDDYLSADIEYGWAKLISEMQLIAFHKQYGLKGCAVRFVTTYGPRENEAHAIIALIYKAIEQMDPYEIWGDGESKEILPTLKILWMDVFWEQKKYLTVPRLIWELENNTRY